MSGNITIPVTAALSKQADGTYAVVTAEYADIPAAALARWLLERFNVPVVEGGRG
jgi:hypothetical protein